MDASPATGMRLLSTTQRNSLPGKTLHVPIEYSLICQNSRHPSIPYRLSLGTQQNSLPASHVPITPSAQTLCFAPAANLQRPRILSCLFLRLHRGQPTSLVSMMVPLANDSSLVVSMRRSYLLLYIARNTHFGSLWHSTELHWVANHFLGVVSDNTSSCIALQFLMSSLY